MNKVVHVVNQFFAGLGGEDKADMPVDVIDGSAGAARGLQSNSAGRARSSHDLCRRQLFS